MVNKDEHTKCK